MKWLSFDLNSCQHIPKPEGEVRGEVIDPYVKVRVRGHPDDQVSEFAIKLEKKTIVILMPLFF